MSVDPSIIGKIRALYRLSKDPCNEHEAALAADRVRELLATHNLSLGEVLNEKSEGTERAWGTSKRGVERYKVLLATACDCLFDVGHFIQPRWNGYRDRLSQRATVEYSIVFCGLHQNVEAAILTMDYFQRAILSLLSKRTEIHAPRRRNCYRNGAATRIAFEAEKLKKAAVAADGQTMALVHIGNAVAKRQMATHDLHPRPIAQQRVNQAFLKGYADGGQVNLKGGVQKRFTTERAEIAEAANG